MEFSFYLSNDNLNDVRFSCLTEARKFVLKSCQENEELLVTIKSESRDDSIIYEETWNAKDFIDYYKDLRAEISDFIKEVQFNLDTLLK